MSLNATTSSVLGIVVPDRLEHLPPDAAKTVDTDFRSHCKNLLVVI